MSWIKHSVAFFSTHMKQLMVTSLIIFDVTPILGATFFDGDNQWTYSISGLYATIVKADPAQGDIVVPEKLGGCVVADIADQAFCNRQSLTSIVIPGCVRRIGEYAFDRCKALRTVKLSPGLESIGECAFNECIALESIVIPNGVHTLGGSAFHYCKQLGSIVIPESVRMVDTYAFSMCDAITNVVIPSCVKSLSATFTGSYRNIEKVAVANGATSVSASVFAGAIALREVDLPATVTSIGDSAFLQCSALLSVILHGDAPDLGANVFEGTPKRLITTVPENSIGWDGSITTRLPETWGGRAIVHSGQTYDWNKGGAAPLVSVLTVSNIVVHYIMNSVKPTAALPPCHEMGFVNVITEVKGGCVAVPSSWPTAFPSFALKFGTDLNKALIMKTGKKDATGTELFVWQDYVAGTDPTDEKDVFKASVTLVDGAPVVSYTPELSDAETAKRKYTTWGKVRLQDLEWIEVEKGREVDYNFFKVTVEML